MSKPKCLCFHHKNKKTKTDTYKLFVLDFAKGFTQNLGQSLYYYYYFLFRKEEFRRHERLWGGSGILRLRWVGHYTNWVLGWWISGAVLRVLDTAYIFEIL